MRKERPRHRPPPQKLSTSLKIAEITQLTESEGCLHIQNIHPADKDAKKQGIENHIRLIGSLNKTTNKAEVL